MGERIAEVHTTNSGEAAAGKFFAKHAMGRRGVVGVVDVPGEIRVGDRVIVRLSRPQKQADARTARAQAILTTEKDGVRLQTWLPFEPPLATMPLRVSVEPADEFRVFLADRIAAERTSAA